MKGAGGKSSKGLWLLPEGPAETEKLVRSCSPCVVKSWNAGDSVTGESGQRVRQVPSRVCSLMERGREGMHGGGGRASVPVRPKSQGMRPLSLSSRSPDWAGVSQQASLSQQREFGGGKVMTNYSLRGSCAPWLL